NKHPEELFGAWNMSLRIPECQIITNSDQTSWDFNSEGIGSITISGDIQAELKYIVGNAEIVVISSLPPFDLVSEQVFPSYALAVFANSIIYFVVSISEDERYNYIIEPNGPIFDFENLRVSFSELEYNISIDESVTFNGTLSSEIINIPANTPTIITLVDQIELGNKSYIFNNDGSVITQKNQDEDSFIGSWEVDGDLLYIIDSLNINTTGKDTSVYTYSIKTETLTLISAEELNCDDEIDREDCIREFEYRLFLDSGSLTEVSYFEKQIFSRTHLYSQKKRNTEVFLF
ncbi:hypothetical protein ACFLSY_12055, partial [Bacteroidota bacterium]